MRWLKGILAFFFVLIAGVAAIVVWIWLSFPTTSYRYRLTIVVELDGRVHSGSSVIEVRYRFFPEFFSQLANGNQYERSVAGQAVLVELGERGVLIAALGDNGDHTTVAADALAGRAFQPNARQYLGGYKATFDGVRALSRSQGRIALAMDNLPPFIWFSDSANPATGRLIKPREFANVMGDKAGLQSAEIEITRDPVIIDIDKKLPLYRALLANNGFMKLSTGLVLNWGMFVAPGSSQ